MYSHSLSLIPGHGPPSSEEEVGIPFIELCSGSVGSFTTPPHLPSVLTKSSSYTSRSKLQEVEWGDQEAGGKAVYKPGQEGSGIMILHI